MQFHRPVRVLVCRREDFVTDSRLDREFFAQLARETGVERLSGCTLAAGKFPIALEVNACWSSRDQEVAIAFDDRGGHDQGRHASGEKGNALQPLAIGQTRHFGLRATQIVAPRSINAWLKSKTSRRGTSASA